MAPEKTTPVHARIDVPEYERLYRAERILLMTRWFAAIFAFLQVITYYLPYPGVYLQVALGVVALIVVGNAIFARLLHTMPKPERIRNIALASLAFDIVVCQAFILTYAFDEETAIWIVMYVVPLGAAMRFQRKGAMIAATALSVGYLSRELLGSMHYHREFLLASVTFRCGIAYLIAYVAGSSANEMLQTRRRVEQSNRELLELNRSMRDFVSIASHDMRTPVSVISGLSNTIVRDGDSMPETQKRELIEVIHRRALSLDRLVNDLLATSNIDAGILPHRPEKLDLFDLLHDIAKNDASHTVHVEVERETFAYADGEHVRRIIGNLLTNAVHYGQPPVTIRATSAPPWITLAVIDKGPGVPEFFKARLFEKFARAPESSRLIEGTGLGLSIVKGLALQNGGSVKYLENDGGGACFSVTLAAWPPAGGNKGR